MWRGLAEWVGGTSSVGEGVSSIYYPFLLLVAIGRGHREAVASSSFWKPSLLIGAGCRKGSPTPAPLPYFPLPSPSLPDSPYLRLALPLPALGSSCPGLVLAISAVGLPGAMSGISRSGHAACSSLSSDFNLLCTSGELLPPGSDSSSNLTGPNVAR